MSCFSLECGDAVSTISGMSLPTPCTLDDAYTEFDRCVAYKSDTSGALARDLEAAITWILVRRPNQSLTSQRADTRFQSGFDQGAAKILEQVQSWLATLNTSAAVEAATIESSARLPRQFSLELMRG